MFYVRLTYFITLTGQYFNDLFQYQSSILGFRNIIKERFASYIKSCINFELESPTIKDKITGTTIVNAAVMKKAIDNEFGVRCSCLAHLLGDDYELKTCSKDFKIIKP